MLVNILSTLKRGWAIILTVENRGFSRPMGYKNINKSQTVKKLEKRKRRLQRSVSRKYEQNKKGERYCKTKNVIKNERLLLKVNHR